VHAAPAVSRAVPAAPSSAHADTCALFIIAPGLAVALDIEATALVSDLKAHIQSRLGIPAERQRLAVAGGQLADGQTLVEAGVGPGSTVQLLIRGRGGAFSGTAAGVDAARGPPTSWAERARFSQAFSRSSTAITVTVEKSIPTKVGDLFGVDGPEPPPRPTLYIFDRDAARLSGFKAGQALLRDAPVDSFRGTSVLEAFPAPADAARLADEYNALVDGAPQGRLALATAERAVPSGAAPWLIRPAMGRGGVMREEDKGAWATRVIRALTARGVTLQAPYLCTVKGGAWLAGSCPQGSTRLAREARELGFERKVSAPSSWCASGLPT
jgi:hypothetical protein